MAASYNREKRTLRQRLRTISRYRDAFRAYGELSLILSALDDVPKFEAIIEQVHAGLTDAEDEIMATIPSIRLTASLLPEELLGPLPPITADRHLRELALLRSLTDDAHQAFSTRQNARAYALSLLVTIAISKDYSPELAKLARATSALSLIAQAALAVELGLSSILYHLFARRLEAITAQNDDESGTATFLAIFDYAIAQPDSDDPYGVALSMLASAFVAENSSNTTISHLYDLALAASPRSLPH